MARGLYQHHFMMGAERPQAHSAAKIKEKFLINMVFTYFLPEKS
jgi:hypothetical protein